jgi:hypothetical protein
MMRQRMMRPRTEPTTIPAILPLLIQRPLSESGAEVWVGVVVAVVVDVPVVLEVEDASVVALVFGDGCSLLAWGFAVVDGVGGGGGGDGVLRAGEVAVTVGVGTEVMKAIDVTNWMDVTRSGGLLSS